MGRVVLLAALLVGCDAEPETGLVADLGVAFDARVDGPILVPDADLVDAWMPEPDAMAPDPDAAEPDAAEVEPDEGVEPPPSCDAFAGLAGPDLVAALHTYTHDAYRPIEPELDRGGMLNRYTTARHLMFTQVERFLPPDGDEPGVECVYTGRFVATGPDEEPDHQDVNAEHVWPRQRLDADDESALFSHQESDIHHLFPSDARANAARGHLPFGEADSDRDLGYLPAVVGTDLNGDRVFQPREERRGDVARALFYVSVRWGLEVEAPEEDVLRRWSGTDPVDARERMRNDAVEGQQGNRNPFVDCPQIAERIDDFAAFEALDVDLALP